MSKATATKVSKVEGFVASNESPSISTLKYKFGRQLHAAQGADVMIVYRCYNPACPSVIASYNSKYPRSHGRAKVGEPIALKDGLNSIKRTKCCPDCEHDCIPEIYVKDVEDPELVSDIEKDLAICEQHRKENGED